MFIQSGQNRTKNLAKYGKILLLRNVNYDSHCPKIYQKHVLLDTFCKELGHQIL